MANRSGFPGLACTTGGYDYQITADERYLYFVRLGKTGEADVAKSIMKPEEYAAEWGNVRMPKSGVEAVRCMRLRGEVVISIVRGEHSYRFAASDDTDEKLLMEVFSNLPLRMTMKRVRRGGKLNALELALFIGCFVLAAVQMLGSALLGLEMDALAIGWMLIPPAWLVHSARRAEKGRSGFSLGIGAMAALFSCLFLWLTPDAKPDNWMQAVLPMACIAAAAAALYAVAGKKIRWIPMAAVAIAVMLLYAPGVVLSLNEMLPAVGTRTVDASVTELTSEYDRGDWLYYVVAESEAGQTVHQVSREEYAQLSESSAVTIITTTGALGVDYTDLRVDAQ